MKISIRERFAPFSHRPGASCLIPGTSHVLQAFPTLLKVGSLKLYLHLTGPVEGFTLQQDLEQGCAFVFGKAKEGFYRIKIGGSEEGISLFVDRVFEGGLSISGAQETVVRKKELLVLSRSTSFFRPLHLERLSLGVHRGQDWDLVKRRFDLREIVPFVYALGQRTPFFPIRPIGGTGYLLEFPLEKKGILAGLEAFCKAGLGEILVPRLLDADHQGLCPEEKARGDGEDPSALLRAAFQKIRSLFFQTQDQRVSLLPCNPFDAGRLVSLYAEGIGEWDLEWRQGLLRRAVFRSHQTGDLVLQLQKELKGFRVRLSMKEKGKKLRREEPLVVEANTTYLLDRFQK